MSQVIAIVNQKGGVGKTTTGINLSASLAAADQRVLLVDLDPQGNATMGSGVDKRTLKASSYDVLVGGAEVATVMLSLEQFKYTLLPSNSDLTGAEVMLLEQADRESRLKTALGSVREQYDFIFIDCPPALNMLTVNALVAAQSVLIPMQCEYYALEGLSALIATIKKIRQHANPALRIEGLLRTMFDPRNNLSEQVSAQLMAHFGDKVYKAIIPRNVRLAEAPSHGQPALYYDKSSSGAQAYMALAEEILQKYAPSVMPGPQGWRNLLKVFGKRAG
jgi:chromosome partitioning protein